MQAACAMELWRKADFEGERIVVDALVRRRSAEKALFLTPPDDGFAAGAHRSMLRPDHRPGRPGPGAAAPARWSWSTSLEGDRARSRRESTLDGLAEPPPEPTPEPSARDAGRRRGRQRAPGNDLRRSGRGAGTRRPSRRRWWPSRNLVLPEPPVDDIAAADDADLLADVRPARPTVAPADSPFHLDAGAGAGTRAEPEPESSRRPDRRGVAVAEPARRGRARPGRDRPRDDQRLAVRTGGFSTRAVRPIWNPRTSPSPTCSRTPCGRDQPAGQPGTCWAWPCSAAASCRNLRIVGASTPRPVAGPDVRLVAPA